MDPEQTSAALRLQNEQLRQENDQLKSMLIVVKENIDLRARMQSFNDTLEDLTVTKPSVQWQNTADEGQFRKDLQKTRFKHEHRTSSPLNFKSFVQSSVHTDTIDDGDLQSCQTDIASDVKGPNRLLGEIAYQLDKRILYHVFQCHKRLYGFTLLNIPEKITEVSTHPLTGKVDEDYRLHLTQRHADLMDRLKQFGYKTTLHPPFTEFIVNAYGILKERPSEHSNQGIDYNNPSFLRKLIMTNAPRKLQKDLLLVLTCLCYMAERDRKPLLLC
ncbi:speriolin-like protein isoform X2 [Mugil cephalus]|uniref:speriolin-like protein isoform X2 n=1 Tax=Mugil cephalus TaxID=48193 RepID=UPI001FB75D88|nr:speriolin-like protein isoform X2 [Mugil cephalus]